MSATDLASGIASARAGRLVHAREQLLRVLAHDPHNETALLWLSRVMPSAAHALLCIDQLLTVNPQHTRAQTAREMLQMRLLMEETTIFRATPPTPSTSQQEHRLGDLLLTAGYITPAQLEMALNVQRRLTVDYKPLRLSEILVQLEIVRPEQLEAALATQTEAARAARPKLRIGTFFVQRGLITDVQLRHALTQQAILKRRGQKLLLGDLLVRYGYVQREQLKRALREWEQAASPS